MYTCDLQFYNPFINNYSDNEPDNNQTPGPVFAKTPAATPEPTPLSTSITTPEPTPEPTPDSTPEPTSEPTPEPTSEPTPELTSEPTPAPTPEPTPEPTSIHNVWTWISGSNSGGGSGSYGTKGVASGSNIPGARQDSICWIDSSDSLWLFGGIGYDKTGSNGILNDLWKYDGTNWTWISGSDTRDQSGIYGSKGVPDSANIPGARQDSIAWIDSTDNLWLFGGYGLDSGSTKDQLNDLWKYDGANWSWISGSNTRGQSGIYGSKGVPDGANIAGARQDSIAWIDSTDNLWLFGGYGLDSTGSTGRLNDLWKYDGTNWTWISGSNTVNHSGVYGTKGVPAGSNMPGTRRYSLGWIDSDDTLWLFGGAGEDCTGNNGHLNDLWKYDGVNWTWISGSNTWCETGVYGTKGMAASSNVPGARYYSTGWIDASGNLWLFGGYGYDSTGSKLILNDLWKYDRTNWTWMSGSNTGDQTGTYGTKGVPAETNMPGGRYSSISRAGTADNFRLFGGYGFDSTSSKDKLNDLWNYQP